MIKIEINGLEFFVKSNISVLEACKYVGITIPRFCYHETLSVAGNCRMCLVEISNSPKPVASCALPVLNNMKIFVDTPLVKKARENVLETLLLNHPLDCPICDQGGECDLQDQTKLFGGDYSRFFFNKRGVEDKYCGPLIKTIMTRCIHCTRCVRFGTEIAGVEYLGTLNRGGSTEIGGYLSNSFNSEISGNVIDLCPVGALTSKPYTFKARPWELRTNESIDLTDNLGSNLYINFKESEIVRITPKINFELNDNLISDKARFSYDSQKTERLQRLFQKDSITNKFLVEDWSSFLIKIQSSLEKNKKITVLVNDELDLEALNFAKMLSFKYNVNIKNINTKGFKSNFFISWVTNKISDLKKDSKICFILSSNLRIESALLNAKLRLKFINDDFKVYGLTQISNSNFGIQFVNLNIQKLILFVEGKNHLLSKQLIAFPNPILCLGDNLNKYGINKENFLVHIKKVAPTSIVIDNVSSCNSQGLSFLNIENVSKNDFLTSDLLFCINLDDNCIMANNLKQSKANIIWANSHGSALALKANVIIPIFSEFEEERIFMNLEERPQKSLKTFTGIHNSRSIQNLFKVLINSNKENNFSFFNFNSELILVPSLFKKIKTFFPLFKIKINEQKNLFNFTLIKPLFNDFYRSNKITKHSLIMAKCSQEMRKITNNFV